MSELWCVTIEHESREIPFDPDDFGMSLLGLFNSKEAAIKYTHKVTDNTIKWEKSWKDELFEGIGATGNYYLLFQHGIIGEDDKGEFYKVAIEELTNE